VRGEERRGEVEVFMQTGERRGERRGGVEVFTQTVPNDGPSRTTDDSLSVSRSLAADHSRNDGLSLPRLPPSTTASPFASETTLAPPATGPGPGPGRSDRTPPGNGARRYSTPPPPPSPPSRSLSDPEVPSLSDALFQRLPASASLPATLDLGVESDQNPAELASESYERVKRRGREDARAEEEDAPDPP
jgi:hypothetical protein